MTDLDYVEFFKLFETFEHTVFQFETRESYAGVATKPFSHFLAGNLTKVWDTDASWLQNVRAQTAGAPRARYSARSKMRMRPGSPVPAASSKGQSGPESSETHEEEKRPDA